MKTLKWFGILGVVALAAILIGIVAFPAFAQGGWWNRGGMTGGYGGRSGTYGPGFSPKELPHVFERFWRAETSRARQTGGSGIGLALVKQLVEAHGGRVSVESVSGQGATFRIVLPVVS